MISLREASVKLGAKDVMGDVTLMETQDMADAIIYALSAPPRVQVTTSKLISFV